jgi:hypothetical protein
VGLVGSSDLISGGRDPIMLYSSVCMVTAQTHSEAQHRACYRPEGFCGILGRVYTQAGWWSTSRTCRWYWMGGG